jgi:predicted RNase H-like HicB family nuclease
MEAITMAHEYNLSLIFYPRQEGGFMVICPELEACFTEGRTMEEATAHIKDIIADFLPDKIENEINEEFFREGLCMEGKIFQEMKAAIDPSGEVVFSPVPVRGEAFSYAVPVEA